MSRPVNPALRFAFLALLVALPVAAHGEASLTWIGNGSVTDLSADGHVAVGLTNQDLDVFRWTEAGGTENLGGSTLFLGIGAGNPRVNANGTRICATIVAEDSTSITQGMWSPEAGWQTLPLPAGGAPVDNNLGSAWNLSGDGGTVVGLFWLPPARAHASAWSAAGGPIDLGSQGGDSRANAASRDGSVIVGWSADPTTGSWQPTVWEGGVMTVLDPTGPGAEACDVSPDGQMIVGQSENPETGMAEAALYFRDAGDPTGWTPQRLGVLPGTSDWEGRSMALDASSDGGIVIGINYYSNFNRTDFIWTPTFGMMTAADFLAQAGVSLATTFRLRQISAVSDDGRYLAGYGYDLYDPSTTVSFVVDLGGVAPVPTAPKVGGLLLEPNFPNPFNPSTTLAFVMGAPGHVEVLVHDLRGRLVRALHRGRLGAGRHSLIWDGRDDRGTAVASAVYLAVVRDSAGHRSMQPMTLVK